MITILDFKLLLSYEFVINPMIISIDTDGAGRVYVCIDADVDSRDVQDFLRAKGPLGFQYIVVTDSGWKK